MNPDSTPSVPPEQLLSRTAWLRRLARHLLDDPQEAEDAVQDVMVAALREGPATGRIHNLQAWLAQVLRRTARRRRENARRRHQREAQVARRRADQSTAAPPADEIVEQAAMQRRVVGLVLQMAEPYRSTILLRYWADLRPKQVAARMQVPVDTVYARLRRGLAQLRGRLEDQERDWRGALLPFAFGRVLPWSAAVGVASMSMPVKIATGATCALVALLIWSFGFDPVFVGPGESDPPEGGGRLHGDAGQVAGDGKIAAEGTDGRSARQQLDRQAVADGLPVRGVVQRSNGRPIPSVKITAQLYLGHETTGEPERQEELVADAGGRFEWPLPLPDQTAVLMFRSAQPLTWRGFGRRLVLRGTDAPQDLVVQGTVLDVAITGRVFGSGDKPVEGAMIKNPFVDVEVRSGADGSYRMPASSISSNAILYCRKEGYALAQAEVGTGSKSGSRSHDFHLKPGVSLRGKVVDTENRPLQGAWIRGSYLFGAMARTDKNGSFHLTSLDPTIKRQELWFNHREFISKKVFLPTDAQEVEHTVVLQRAVRVEGRVFGPDQEIVAGAELTIRPKGQGGDSTVSLEDGSFVFRRANRGDLMLEAKSKGMATASMPVQVPAGVEVVRDITVRMEREQFLGGQIVDDLGRSVGAEAGVVAWRGRQYFGDGGRTDKDGRFRLTGLSAGVVKLEVYGSGFTRRTIRNVQVGQENLRIVLQRSAGFAGRVLDGTTNKPVKRFKVRIVPADRRPGEKPAGSYSSGWATPGMVFQSAKGTWSTREIGGDEFRVGGLLGFEISAKGYAPHMDRRVPARADARPEDFEVRLMPAPKLHGRVVDAAGSPVVRATVRVSTSNRPLHLVGSWYDHTSITARTDKEGRFRIADAPVGELTLRVEHVGHAWYLDGPFSVQSGQEVEREIRLQEGGRLFGTAPGGSRLHLFTIGSAVAPDFHAEVRADSSGRFQFPHTLRPGRYLVYTTERTQDGYWRWYEARPEIIAGKKQQVTLKSFGAAGLRSRPGGSWRKGRFRLADGDKPGHGPWIELPLTKGGFEVRGLPPGNYDVHRVGVVEVKVGKITDAVR